LPVKNLSKDKGCTKKYLDCPKISKKTRASLRSSTKAKFVYRKPPDAVDYAYVLMQTRPVFSAIAKSDLDAQEIDTPQDKV
jgi:hypothetical protein